VPKRSDKPDRRYFQVIVTYVNGDTHTVHHIFKKRLRAEHYAARLNTPLVKKLSVKEIPPPQLGRRVHNKGRSGKLM
jgi:hypothetical protein